MLEPIVRSAVLIAILAGASRPGLTQQIRREVTNATTPADDSKPNSDRVPDVYAVSGQFDRIVTLRLKYQADLLAGIEKVYLISGLDVIASSVGKSGKSPLFLSFERLCQSLGCLSSNMDLHQSRASPREETQWAAL